MGTFAVSGCPCSDAAVEKPSTVGMNRIEQDEIGLERVSQLDGVSSGHRDSDLVAAPAQQRRADLGVVELVVDDEHARHSVVAAGCGSASGSIDTAAKQASYRVLRDSLERQAARSRRARRRPQPPARLQRVPGRRTARRGAMHHQQTRRMAEPKDQDPYPSSRYVQACDPLRAPHVVGAHRVNWFARAAARECADCHAIRLPPRCIRRKARASFVTPKEVRRRAPCRRA